MASKIYNLKQLYSFLGGSGSGALMAFGLI